MLWHIAVHMQGHHVGSAGVFMYVCVCSLLRLQACTGGCTHAAAAWGRIRMGHAGVGMHTLIIALKKSCSSGVPDGDAAAGAETGLALAAFGALGSLATQQHMRGFQSGV